MNGNGIGNLLFIAKSSGIKVAANGLLQLSPRSFIARFRIDLMQENIRLTEDEVRPFENRCSLKVEASLKVSAVISAAGAVSFR